MPFICSGVLMGPSTPLRVATTRGSMTTYQRILNPFSSTLGFTSFFQASELTRLTNRWFSPHRRGC